MLEFFQSCGKKSKLSQFSISLKAQGTWVTATSYEISYYDTFILTVMDTLSYFQQYGMLGNFPGLMQNLNIHFVWEYSRQQFLVKSTLSKRMNLVENKHGFCLCGDD